MKSPARVDRLETFASEPLRLERQNLPFANKNAVEGRVEAREGSWMQGMAGDGCGVKRCRAVTDSIFPRGKGGFSLLFRPAFARRVDLFSPQQSSIHAGSGWERASDGNFSFDNPRGKNKVENVKAIHPMTNQTKNRINTNMKNQYSRSEVEAIIRDMDYVKSVLSWRVASCVPDHELTPPNGSRATTRSGFRAWLRRAKLLCERPSFANKAPNE